jgi:hypothetical protein
MVISRWRDAQAEGERAAGQGLTRHEYSVLMRALTLKRRQHEGSLTVEDSMWLDMIIKGIHTTTLPRKASYLPAVHPFRRFVEACAERRGNTAA